MPQVRKPTFKQKKFVHRYLKHGDGTKAIKESYDITNSNSAAALATRNKKAPHVQAYMKEIMDNVGITDEKIAGDIKRIINAGTTKRALKTTTPQTALKAIDMASKMKDIFPAERKEIEKRTATLNIDLSGKSQEELQETLDDLIYESKQFRKMLNETTEVHVKPVNNVSHLKNTNVNHLKTNVHP